MSSNIITLIKLDTVHLYVDQLKKILFFDVLNSTYKKENCITVLEYFKNFWILAKDKNLKYFLIIKINSIGIYPLDFYNNLVNCLTELNDIFINHLHSCYFLCNNSNPIILLKPLFKMYNFIRPLHICNAYEEAIILSKDSKNNLTT
tara:strand:- start:1896 stop:2336 length:441 start_codon:yes stop_codon:yes gene_type:complete